MTYEVPCSFQSVIDRPDRVSRVIPPTETIPATRPAIPSNQYPTGRSVDELDGDETEAEENLTVDAYHRVIPN